MQSRMEMDGETLALREGTTAQGLYALLALVGARRLTLDALRVKSRLSPTAFANLLRWLQKEYLVDVVSTLDSDGVHEAATLTEKGEALLVSLLEQTCELPELH